jgi:hypothetical protein
VRQDGASVGVVAVVSELRPGSREGRPDYELRLGTLESLAGAPAYLAAGSIGKLLDIVLALTAALAAPPASPSKRAT